VFGWWEFYRNKQIITLKSYIYKQTKATRATQLLYFRSNALCSDILEENFHPKQKKSLQSYYSEEKIIIVVLFGW